jgi:hypothetical protein
VNQRSEARFRAAIAAAIPAVDGNELDWRWRAMVSVLMFYLLGVYDEFDTIAAEDEVSNRLAEAALVWQMA